MKRFGAKPTGNLALMGYYDGDVILFGRAAGHTIRLQINDTEHAQWEAILAEATPELVSIYTGEPVAVQISDPDDDRNSWSAPAHWVEGHERPVLHGEQPFAAP